jgi:hypothetical protein
MSVKSEDFMSLRQAPCEYCFALSRFGGESALVHNPAFPSRKAPYMQNALTSAALKTRTFLIPEKLARPKAIIVSMLSEGYRAIAAVADEALWEDERNLAFDPALKNSAARRALILKRAAENLEGKAGPMRPRQRTPDGQDKRSPYGCHSGRALR